MLKKVITTLAVTMAVTTASADVALTVGIHSWGFTSIYGSQDFEWHFDKQEYITWSGDDRSSCWEAEEDIHNNPSEFLRKNTNFNNIGDEVYRIHGHYDGYRVSGWHQNDRTIKDLNVVTRCDWVD